MKDFPLLFLITFLLACGTKVESTSEEQHADLAASTAIEKLLETDDGISEPKKLKVQFVLYDNQTLEEESNIEDKLNHISNQLFVKYGVPKEEDTIKVHVWRNYEQFLVDQERFTGTQFPGSSGYILSPTEIALLYNDNMIEAAEHEYAHASSLAISNELGHSSRWLWEAFAIYESDEFYHPKDLAYLRQGRFPSIAELNGKFDGEGANRIYEVGFLISEFVVEHWSSEKYLELVQEAGNIEKTLDVSISDFEKLWQEFVKEKYF